MFLLLVSYRVFLIQKKVQNNPPYQSDPNSSASDYLGTGMSYLQIAAQKAKDNATWAAE